MRFVLCVLVSLLAVTSAGAQNPAATTVAGTAMSGANNIYTFTSGSGQVTGSLSWDTQGANLLMVLVCGSAAEVFTYATAAGLLDRFARFESGVPGPVPCVVAVTSADQSASFRLHVTRSGDQTLTPASAAGFVALSEARQGTFLSDEAGRALGRLKELLR